MTGGDRRLGCVWAVGLATLSACATAGSGGAGPASTATINASDVFIDSIDGNNMRGNLAEARTRFVVAPGRHEIGISRHVFGPGLGMMRSVRSEYATVCIEAAGGHVYTARPQVQPDGSWTTHVFDHTTSTWVAPTCASAPAPIVASDGVADGAAPAASTSMAPPGPVAASLTAPITDRRPHRPGTGLALRIGRAFGGDTLAGAPSGGGDTLDAGAGATLSLGGTVTPFWNAKDFGLGAGLELGLKFGLLNGDAGGSFLRFPLLATVHVLTRLSGAWYVKLAAGAEKHLGSRISRTGGSTATVQGELGPVGEIGLYVLVGRHAAMEASLRYSRLRYTVGTRTIDGDSVGFLLAAHYNIRAW